MFLLDEPVVFGSCGVVGLSSFGSLSDVFGPAQLNLMAHFRFGAFVMGAVGVAAWCSSRAGLATGILFPHPPNVIHLFLGAGPTGGCDFGETLTVSGNCDVVSFVSTTGTLTELMGLDAKEYGAKLV